MEGRFICQEQILRIDFLMQDWRENWYSGWVQQKAPSLLSCQVQTGAASFSVRPFYFHAQVVERNNNQWDGIALNGAEHIRDCGSDYAASEG